MLGGDGTALPDVRGYLGFTDVQHLYGTCSPPAADRPDSEACAVRYDAATGRVEADRGYPSMAADPVLDALRAEVADLDDSLAAPDLLTPCLEARGVPDPWSSDVRPTGDGPQADAWRRCLLDATDVGTLGRS